MKFSMKRTLILVVLLLVAPMFTQGQVDEVNLEVCDVGQVGIYRGIMI